MYDEIGVPKERIGIVIGKGGEVLKRLRKDTRTRIFANDDLITIEGEALNVLEAKNVIEAIIRGFSPDKAFLVLEEYVLKTIDLSEHSSKKRLKELKSRIIGSKGRTKEIIEEQTNSHIVIDDHHVSVICKEDDLDSVLDALERFIAGQGHKMVYKHLGEKKNG